MTTRSPYKEWLKKRSDMDARVRDAAPELLAAMEKMVKYLTDTWCDICGVEPDEKHEDYCPIPTCQAAINKAKGSK